MSGPPAATASVMSTVKSKTRTSSSIPIMRTGPSAGSKADPHALTLPPSNPALPASHVVASVRSDRLEEEAQRMETRLAALKVAMNTEKAEREKIKKTKAGTFWKAAAPVAEGASYMDDMKARIEKRVAKANTLMATTAAATKTTGATTNAPANRGANVKPSSSNTPSTSSSSSSAASSDLAATQQRSSYVPPVQPKNAVSATSAPRLQASSEATPTATTTLAAAAASTQVTAASSSAAAQPIASARKPMASAGSNTGGASASSSSSTAASAAASASSASPSFLNPADDENRSAAPGSLLDGDFDEQANKAWFEAARQEWIDETQAAATATATAKSAGRVQLVHDPDYSPAIPASSSSSGSGGGLLDGPAFNERESAKEFAEARKAWMQSLAAAPTTSGTTTAAAAAASKHHRPSETAAQQAGTAQPDGMWNPSIALGQGGSILFPSEQDEEAEANESAASASGGPALVSSVLRSHQRGLEKTAKASCYQCYRLFYTASASKLLEDDWPGRMFCSDACAEESAKSAKLRCSAGGCARSFLRSEGRRLGASAGVGSDNPIYCVACAENGGVHVAPAPMAATAASVDSRIPTASSSPELEDDEDEDEAAAEQERGQEKEQEEEEEEEEEEEADTSGVPEVASPFFPVARGGSAVPPVPVRRPTSSAARPASAVRPLPPQQEPVVVLDPSVVHKAAAPAQAAAAVVEFPSDEDDDI